MRIFQSLVLDEIYTQPHLIASLDDRIDRPDDATFSVSPTEDLTTVRPLCYKLSGNCGSVAVVRQSQVVCRRLRMALHSNEV